MSTGQGVVLNRNDLLDRVLGKSRDQNSKKE
jgi:hypothetical protein